MTKICTIIIDDEVNCRLAGLSPSNLEFLWDKFGIMKEGARHTPQFQLRRWDGKIRFVDKNGKTFTKLLEEIIPYIIAWDYEIDINDKRISSKQIQTVIDNDYFKLIGFKLRDYQVKSINTLINAGSGIGIFATGAGKCVFGDTLINISMNDDLLKKYEQYKQTKTN